MFVIVPGFGPPHLPEKLRILRNNLGILGGDGGCRGVRARVVLYDLDPQRRAATAAAVRAEGAEPVEDPGSFPARALVRYAAPAAIPEGTTDILILLDDCELVAPGFSIEYLRAAREQLGVQLISPALAADSPLPSVFPHLAAAAWSPPAEFIRTPVVELFVYYMSAADWATYYTFLDPELNPYLWGMDLILELRMGLRSAIVAGAQFRHWFKGSGHADGVNNRRAYLAKYGLSEAEVAAQRAVESAGVLGGDGGKRI